MQNKNMNANSKLHVLWYVNNTNSIILINVDNDYGAVYGILDAIPSIII